MSSSMYLFSVVALALIGLSAASHGRYGSISFQKHASNPLLVTINANIAWRRSYFGAPNVGSTIYDIDLDFGDGTSVYPGLTVTSINTNDDWLTAVWSGDHVYGAAGTYTVDISSCCRILSLNNNAGYSYAFTSTLIITAAEVSKAATINNSPVSNMLPIIAVPYGVVPFQYQVLAIDPESDTLKFGMATSNQMAGGSQPPGLSVDQNTGTVTLSSALNTGFWCTQQTVMDSFGNMIVIDYLLNVQTPQKFCNGSCYSNTAVKCASSADCATCDSKCLTATPRIVTNDLSSSSNPATNLPALAAGTTVSVAPGQVYTLSFVVDDVNLVNPASAPYIFTASVPSYAVISAQKDCTSANGCTYRGQFQKPEFLQITLSPTAANAATSTVVCVGATSLGNALPYSQHCINIEVVASTCGNGIVESGEVCDGGACCAANCKAFTTSGSVCRAANGICDVAETCSGSSASCPADSYATSGTSCRPSAGICDIAETCTGASTSCPVDVFASGSTCRPSAGDCDVAETCSGASASCPADVFVSSATTCRASAGICDVAENCSGVSASCPTDAFAPTTTTCRLSAGVCDAPETCSGVTASCPSDSLYGTSTVCRPAVDTCDTAETCTGNAIACPADQFVNTTACKAAKYVCPRLSNANGVSNYWCSPYSNGNYYTCLTGAYAAQSAKMTCPTGTKCTCPYGVDCGQCGGPCTMPNDPPPTPDTCQHKK